MLSDRGISAAYAAVKVKNYLQNRKYCYDEMIVED